jgi:phosphoglycolate phosphatase-like HAD superfamily hydrolase
VAAAWGYLGDGVAVTEWQADVLVDDPAQLPEALKSLRMP